MIKRLIATIIVALTLVVGVPNIGYTQSADDGSGANINAALCVGASLDLSAASAANCIRQTQPSNVPVQPPSDTAIWQGLCVGASLDLSAASAANCARQAAQGQSSWVNVSNMSPQSVQSIPPSQTRTNNHINNPSTLPGSPPAKTGANYAAMGDSVAAGLGLSAGSSGQTDSCGRSPLAYPNLVARARNLSLTNVACTGATAGDLVTQQRISGPNLPPQVDQAFASGTPQLITITVGANDLHWNAFLRKCFTATCGTATDDRIMASLRAGLNAKLEDAFSQIQQRANGTMPPVIITGYFNPVSQACAQIEPRITSAEISWITQQLHALNQTIRGSTNGFPSVSFVPINFTGHDICSSQPWVQGLNEPAPFHPNAAGQAAIAQMIN